MSDAGVPPSLEAVLRSLDAETVRSAGLEAEVAKFRSLLGAMNRAYVSLRNRKNDEIADLRRRLAEHE